MFGSVLLRGSGLGVLRHASRGLMSRSISNLVRTNNVISTIGLKRALPTASIASFHSSVQIREAVQFQQNTIAGSSTTKPAKARPLLNSSKVVGYWLVGTSILVFGIVVLGGLTRLTESGLSITEWRPVAGTVPPLNQQEWEDEFEKYKSSPEFKQLNSHITLDEFKFIFFMEWIHRLWGRAIGAVFILPAVYFAVAKKTSPHVNKRLFGLAALLGLQGFIGWWMVKSGLDEDQLKERKSKPTVSQYRLTTHLGAAFMLYMGMLWTGFEIVREAKWVKNPSEALVLFSKLDNPALAPLRRSALGLLALTFATAMTGGLVAGLDAGLIYNTFPHMGDDWVPSKRELMDENFARKDDKSDIFWRNMLENPTTAIIPKQATTTAHAMMGIATAQVTLGIFTLLYLVPISLASAHQAGALALLTSSLLFASQLRKPRAAIRILTGGLYTQKQKAASKILTEASKLTK
ncbi:unnamed protein product [Kluyveromyces dobzhanskii CBS 2104]|uniref:WGS project CCBQ000000000 data, contig 00014 n=1 Tax=Kluyveromyces dobzhanskii CBS 2104 TaxID=1427455 RepID=A0A0A8L6Z4_9SACH|nr:unnamed protein product [Kluyveromyces dobzhanskii CBS 2104]